LGYSPIDAVGVALWTLRYHNTRCTRRTSRTFRTDVFRQTPSRATLCPARRK
jgi:hypothetical protein